MCGRRTLRSWLGVLVVDSERDGSRSSAQNFVGYQFRMTPQKLCDTTQGNTTRKHARGEEPTSSRSKTDRSTKKIFIFYTEMVRGLS